MEDNVFLCKSQKRYIIYNKRGTQLCNNYHLFISLIVSGRYHENPAI